jgi:hypothetical protein
LSLGFPGNPRHVKNDAAAAKGDAAATKAVFRQRPEAGIQ